MSPAEHPGSSSAVGDHSDGSFVETAFAPSEIEAAIEAEKASSSAKGDCLFLSDTRPLTSSGATK